MTIRYSPFAAEDKEWLNALNHRYHANGFMFYAIADSKWAVCHVYPRNVLCIIDSLDELPEVVKNCKPPVEAEKPKPHRKETILPVDFNLDDINLDDIEI